MRYLLTIDVPDRSLLTLAEAKLREIGATVVDMFPEPDAFVQRVEVPADRQFSGHNLDCEPIPEHPFERSAVCRVCGRESTDDVHTDHVGCSNCEPIPEVGREGAGS